MAAAEGLALVLLAHLVQSKDDTMPKNVKLKSKAVCIFSPRLIFH